MFQTLDPQAAPAADRLGPPPRLRRHDREHPEHLRHVPQPGHGPGELEQPGRRDHHLAGRLRVARLGLTYLIHFLGILSINLAVLNFLPIPPLDGGQMVFLIAEKVRGRPLPESALVAGTYLGLFLVLGLMVFVTFQDIFRLIKDSDRIVENSDAIPDPAKAVERSESVCTRSVTGGRSDGRARGSADRGRDAYRLRSDGRTVADLIGRLESGELPAAVVAPGAVTPADVVAALAHDALGGDDSPGLPLVQASRRPGPGWSGRCRSRPGRRCSRGPRTGRGWRWPPGCSRSSTSGTPATRPPSRPTTWASGSSRPTGTASLIAASPTRATPPTGSAGSAAIPSSPRWPRPPGRCSTSTATPPCASRLLSGGWNAMAMIDLCTQARPGSPREILARRLQRLEMWLLLEATFRDAGGIVPGPI